MIKPQKFILINLKNLDMKKTALTVLLFGLSYFLIAQETEPVKNIFMGNRFINLQSANVASKKELQLYIQHRFGDISGGFYELFGLDHASMRLGFEYGFTKNFTAGIGRSTYFKTFDSFLKYRILTQTVSFPFTLTATASGSLPTIKNVFPEEYNDFSGKASGNVQVHAARTFKWFAIQVSPGFIETGYIPNEKNSYSFFTLAAGGSVKISKKVSANVEYLHRFEDKIDYKNPLSLSVDLDTGGHLFQILISNTQQMYDQAIITNPVGDWAGGNLFLGFNLVREFNFNKYDF
jgi:hypothetical protein